jgi:small subunit ribosomal protein S21
LTILFLSDTLKTGLIYQEILSHINEEIKSKSSQAKREAFILSEVTIAHPEDFEKALKQFTRKVQQDGIIAEYRRRQHFESTSVTRKKKAASRKRKDQQKRPTHSSRSR